MQRSQSFSIPFCEISIESHGTENAEITSGKCGTHLIVDVIDQHQRSLPCLSAE